MKVFESFVKNSTLILNSHFDILCGTTPHPIISNNAVELKPKTKKVHNQLKSEASTLPAKKEVKKEAEKEAKVKQPKSNSDFEIFDFSKDEELKTPSSAPAPASTSPAKKEAKEKAMTTQQPKAETKNGEDDYLTFKPDMSYFTPPEDKEADDIPRRPIIGKRSPII